MSTDLIGAEVKGYTILSQIGQGGMATVYLARQRSMDRLAALKFLPMALVKDDAYLQRFEQEARIAAQLEHRNIVPVYDYGEYQGQPFIAMRYLPAGSVEDLLAAGRIPLARVAGIVEQVASALDYAHQRGIVHRDLKPSNILLDDGGGTFITDYGIARILGEGASNITTQGVIGTPSYMSPEQAQGQPLDGRSDVYSLGVMVYEMATGRRPFEADTPYGIAVQHVTAQPPPPSQFAPGIGQRLDAVVLQALSKRPSERTASAGQLAAALRAAVDETADPGATATPARLPATAETLGDVRVEAGRTAEDRPPLRGRRWRGVGLSLMAGSGLGCLLLAALLIMGVALLGWLARDEGGDDSAIVSPDASQPPPPTESTLQLLNAAADATFTADAALRALRPTRPPDAIQPVGLRATPGPHPALAGASGVLVYFAERGGREGLAPVFDIVTLDLESGERVRFNAGGSSVYPRPSPDGRWIAFQADSDGDFEIYLANRFGGQLRQLTRNAVWDRMPAWSPDGQWIVYSSDTRGDETFDLYRVRPDGQDAQPLYSDGWRNSHARYSPAGDRLVFTGGQSARDAGGWEIRMLDPRGGVSQLLTANEVRDASPVFSPDGGRILYVTTVGGARALASMDLAGGERELLYTGPGSVWAASYSPDGRFIVVTATLDGADQLYLMDAAGGGVQQITSDGGAYASWIPAVAEA